MKSVAPICLITSGNTRSAHIVRSERRAQNDHIAGLAGELRKATRRMSVDQIPCGRGSQSPLSASSTSVASEPPTQRAANRRMPKLARRSTLPYTPAHAKVPSARSTCRRCEGRRHRAPGIADRPLPSCRRPGPIGALAHRCTAVVMLSRIHPSRSAAIAGRGVPQAQRTHRRRIDDRQTDLGGGPQVVAIDGRFE